MNSKISFIVLFLSFYCSSKLFCNNDSLIVHDLHKNRINLCDSGTGVLVFAGGLACKKCFDQLNSAIISNRKRFDNIGVLVNSTDDILLKKETIDRYSKFFPKIKYNFYFDTTYKNVFTEEVNDGF